MVTSKRTVASFFAPVLTIAKVINDSERYHVVLAQIFLHE